MAGDLPAFCTEEMDRELFQRGVPIGAGITTAGHGRGAAATGHAAAPADPGRAAAGLARSVSAAAPADPGRAAAGLARSVSAAAPADPGRGIAAAELGRGASVADPTRSRGRSNGHTHARQAPSAVARVRGRGRGRGMNICHTANATMVNGLTSQRSAKNPVDSQEIPGCAKFKKGPLQNEADLSKMFDKITNEENDHWNPMTENPIIPKNHEPIINLESDFADVESPAPAPVSESMHL
ncbi:hypothetical protein ZEAMMB73_Zm00001d033382 [Zea mays]|uniref:Uncharacterized protein n=1 Tax=Zea mays TaxID=4577 RepID=A0A1D6KYR1_MAIZE|nr:hypothetical protein ZEAMMB73_Zm00001d033382 [Zea mays]